MQRRAIVWKEATKSTKKRNIMKTSNDTWKGTTTNLKKGNNTQKGALINIKRSNNNHKQDQ
jgi:hypothetical protein